MKVLSNRLSIDMEKLKPHSRGHKLRPTGQLECLSSHRRDWAAESTLSTSVQNNLQAPEYILHSLVIFDPVITTGSIVID
jgi:hypothetical protein